MPDSLSRLILVYTSDGVAYPDQTCESLLIQELRDLFQNPLGQEKILRVSTENLISAARCLKKEGKLPFELVIRMEKGLEPWQATDYYVLDSGRLEFWPPELNVFDKFLERLL